MSTATIAGIHLDLKYLMPNKAYLNQWVRELPALGMNTLLLEYEDKFPYQKYPFVQHPEAFTPDELRSFLKAAREVGLRVIPLVQTLAHLEFALAHEELAHLRESPNVHTQIDPGNPDAIQFVHDLIEEVLAYHEEDDWFHLGADEAWHLGASNRGSTARIVEEIGIVGLWARHEGEMIRWIMSKGKRPVVWDDIFWKEPEKVAEANLPKETILMVWNYGVTDLNVQKKTDEHGSEFGATTSKLKQVEHYHAAGYETIATPCLNWGVMVPRHDHCLLNTSALSQKVQLSGMMGTVNSAWACFHTLPHAQNLHIAATAAMLKDPKAPLDRKWQDDFLAKRYGTTADGLADTLEQIGDVWEHKVEGLARPITPVVYGYMDLVMHYESIEQRMARGGYPLDWNDVDFIGIFQQKIDLLRKADADGEVTKKIREHIERYEGACRVLDALAARATRHQNEAAYYAIAGETKLLHSRVLLQLIVGEGDVGELSAAWQALRPKLERVLKPFFEPASLEWALRIWWSPTAEVLEQQTSAAS